MGWMWTALSGSYVWTALCYSFIMSLLDHDPQFMGWYVTTIGYWVSLVGYFLPFLWATVQLAVSPVSATSTNEFFNNSIFQMIVGLIMWLFCGLLHIFFAPVYEEYARTLWTLGRFVVVVDAAEVEEIEDIVEVVADDFEAEEDSD